MLSKKEGKKNKQNSKDYANSLILDTYSLEFLNLPKKYKEKDLKEQIKKIGENFS